MTGPADSIRNQWHSVSEELAHKVTLETNLCSTGTPMVECSCTGNLIEATGLHV
jgi:hypothetical protein